MTNFAYTMLLIRRESTKLARLMEKPELGVGHWCLAVFEQIEKLNALQIVQAVPAHLKDSDFDAMVRADG